MVEKPKPAPAIEITEESLKKAETYYRKGEELAERAILSFLRDSPLIVHGGRATNAYLPPWLDRETQDWDIFTPSNAKKQAEELERKLDKRYDGDYFGTEPALHPGTFRIRNKVTGDVIADITLSDRTIAFKKIKGINYATLDYHEDHILETLDNPETAFRHKKDSETLQRIKIYRKMKKRRVQRRRRDDDYLSLSGIGW